MNTRQYFEYELDGKLKHFLLMPGEFTELSELLEGEILNIRQAFERVAGHRDGITNIRLIQERVYFERKQA